MSNYSEMSNDELRIEVAKRKGYEWEQAGTTAAGKPVIGWVLDGDMILLKHWATNIAVAWELVDEMVSKASAVNVITEPSGTVVHVRRYASPSEPIVEFGNTAPRAIVLAWLAWHDTRDA